MPDRLFVYGTLHPDKAPSEVADLVRGFVPLGQGTVSGHLYDLGDYPGIVLDTNGEKVSGQVYRLPPDPTALDRLDAYEEYWPAKPQASLFRRKKTRVTMLEGGRVDCWIYEYNQPVNTADSPLLAIAS